MKSATGYAEAIKDTVSMLEVAEYYGFAVNRRTRKIICPFHEDTHPSMHIYAGSKGYHCFVCGQGGDVIDFVMKLFNLPFIDACKKMDEDFRLNLNIGGERTREEREAAERAYQERLRQKQLDEQNRTYLHALYDAALNRYTYLDRLKIEYAPNDPTGAVSEKYVYACRHIDSAWQDVLDAAAGIRNYEEKRRQKT